MAITVPFGDLKAEVAEIRPEIDATVERVISRGWFVLGQEDEGFEKEWGWGRSRHGLQQRDGRHHARAAGAGRRAGR